MLPKPKPDFVPAGAAGVEDWAVVPKVKPDFDAAGCCASAASGAGVEVWGVPKLGGGLVAGVLSEAADDPAKRPANGLLDDGVLESPVGAADSVEEALGCSGCGVLAELPNKGAAVFVSSFCVALKPAKGLLEVEADWVCPNEKGFGCVEVSDVTFPD